MVCCSIPNCDYYRRLNLRKKGVSDIPVDRVFAVRRPEFAKCPEEKEQRHNLTNIILSLRDASKPDDRIKHALHTEQAGICERHFLKEDIESIGKKGRMRLRRGAIPVLNVPRLTYQMKMRLKQSERRSKPRQHILIQQPEATNKSVKTQTQVGLVLPYENQECGEFLNQAEERYRITFPTNDFSMTSDLLYSLKDRMWHFIVRLQDLCSSMYKVLSQQYTNICDFSREFETTNIEAEILKRLYHHDHFNIILHQQGSENTCNDNTFEQPDTIDGSDGMETSQDATVFHVNNITMADVSDSVEPLQPEENSTSSSSVEKLDNMSVIDILETQKCKVKRKKIIKLSQTPNKKKTVTLKLSRTPNKKKTVTLKLSRTPNKKKIVKYPIEGKIVKIDSTITDTKEKLLAISTTPTTKKSKSHKTISKNNVNKLPIRNSTYYKKFQVEHDEWGTAYKCVVCDELFKKSFLLRDHDIIQHTNTWKNKNIHKCSECGKMVRNLKTHMLKHTKIRNFTCEICGAKFMQHSNLTTHRLRLACILPSFECNICNERFVTEKEYGNHFKEKHLNKKIICDLCGDEVCEKCVEDKHQVTLLKLYKCKFCDESFTFKKEYSEHIKEKHEHDVKLIGWSKCPICSKFYKENNSFQIHLDTHLSRKYLCEYCPKTFKSLTLLKHHSSRKHNTYYMIKS